MAANYGSPVDYAGFWARVAAYLVDCAIIVILYIAISMGSAYAGDIGVLIGAIINFAINLLYWPVMESSARQATFGKSILGIQVTDLNGNRMSFLRALSRNLAKIISSIPLCIGFLLAAFTGRKQALHDIITKSLVVRTAPSHVLKAFSVAIVGLVITIGGSGAYFYYVLLPQMPELQDEIGVGMQDTETSTMPPVAKALPSASTAPQPVSASAIPETAPVALPSPIIAAAVPKSIPESIREPIPEPVKELTENPVQPAADSQQSAPKKPWVTTTSDPMDSQSAAPYPNEEISTPSANQQDAKLMPQRAPVVAFEPDSESRIIRPKYNDIMTAVLRGDQDGVKQLLDLGWWVDKPGADGLTPLIAAVMNRDTPMVQLLLDHGAMPSSQALKIARDKKDAEMAALLEQRGAR